MLTKQEVFTKVVTHLRQQGAKALSEGGNQCMYRAPNGYKCAAGCLIADEHYSRELEGQGAAQSFVRTALERSGVSPVAFALVSELQCVHDGYPFSRWEDEFQNVARQFELEVPQ